MLQFPLGDSIHPLSFWIPYWHQALLQGRLFKDTITSSLSEDLDTAPHVTTWPWSLASSPHNCTERTLDPPAPSRLKEHCSLSSKDYRLLGENSVSLFLLCFLWKQGPCSFFKEVPQLEEERKGHPVTEMFADTLWHNSTLFIKMMLLDGKFFLNGCFEIMWIVSRELRTTLFFKIKW